MTSNVLPAQPNDMMFDVGDIASVLPAQPNDMMFDVGDLASVLGGTRPFIPVLGFFGEWQEKVAATVSCQKRIALIDAKFFDDQLHALAPSTCTHRHERCPNVRLDWIKRQLELLETISDYDVIVVLNLHTNLELEFIRDIYFGIVTWIVVDDQQNPLRLKMPEISPLDDKMLADLVNGRIYEIQNSSDH